VLQPSIGTRQPTKQAAFRLPSSLAMRFHFAALVAALFGSAAAHTHHARRHHARRHHAKLHHTATYASMQHSLDEMLGSNTLGETELVGASRQLEEALLDVALAPNATTPTLRGTSKLPGKVASTLKVEQDHLSELFSHLKSNIGDFNKRESENKKDSAKYADRLRARLKIDKKKLANPNLSEFDHEMLVNRTRTEEHELKFWTAGRSLQHDMFHSNLKLTHGLMSRVKTVMDAYKQVMATGKLDTKLTKVLHETAKTLPKALIQKSQRVKRDVNKLRKHLKISAKLLHRA